MDIFCRFYFRTFYARQVLAKIRIVSSSSCDPDETDKTSASRADPRESWTGWSIVQKNVLERSGASTWMRPDAQMWEDGTWEVRIEASFLVLIKTIRGSHPSNWNHNCAQPCWKCSPWVRGHASEGQASGAACGWPTAKQNNNAHNTRTNEDTWHTRVKSSDIDRRKPRHSDQATETSTWMEYHFARDHLWSFTSDAYVRSGWMAHEKSAGSSRRHVQPNRRDSPQNFGWNNHNWRPFLHRAGLWSMGRQFFHHLDCGTGVHTFSVRRGTSRFVRRNTMMHRSVAYANWTKGCSQTDSSRFFQQSRVKSRSRRVSHNLGIDASTRFARMDRKQTHTHLKDAMTREGESRARAVVFAGEKQHEQVEERRPLDFAGDEQEEGFAIVTTDPACMWRKQMDQIRITIAYDHVVYVVHKTTMHTIPRCTEIRGMRG